MESNKDYSLRFHGGMDKLSDAIDSTGSLSDDSTIMSIDSVLEESIPSTKKSKSKAKKSTLMPQSKKSRMNKWSQDCNSTEALSDDSSSMSMCTKEPVSFTQRTKSNQPVP